MATIFSSLLTRSDAIVLRNLAQDIKEAGAESTQGSDIPDCDDQTTVDHLNNLNNVSHPDFQQTIFTGWDQNDIAETVDRLLVEPYTAWAEKIVRRPTDVVFMTHIIIYLCTSVPSAIALFWHFSWYHGVVHWLMQTWYSGAFTLMLHNHIHNNGILAKEYTWLDNMWPYILEPLMGHTWNSYYYHHVKHHHVENNGPGDLSSTLRYQRDELLHFLCYVGRFLAFVAIELPLYFFRNNKPSLAIRSAIFEFASYGLIYLLAQCNLRSTVFVLIIPLLQLRVGLMIGNWGQHALVDEQDPDSDFRSSITLIDVPVSTFSLQIFFLKNRVKPFLHLTRWV